MIVLTISNFSDMFDNFEYFANFDDDLIDDDCNDGDGDNHDDDNNMGLLL